MYTITKGMQILDVSKVTIYKHMQKCGIEKGRKLTDNDIKALKKSISKTKKVSYNDEHIQLERLQANKERVELEKRIDDIEEELSTKDVRIRELESLLTQKEIILSDSQKEQAELLRENRRLLEAPKKKWFWQK